jgi:predicted nucleic acid-binding protein
MAVLVDSNVLLDVATRDPAWLDWSRETLRRLADETELVINEIVFAEVSVGYDDVAALDATLPPHLYRREHLPYAAGFLAGKVFRDYRRRGGERRSPMPDFYIGAHAAVARHELLTRDPGRYRGYFPTVTLITP